MTDVAVVVSTVVIVVDVVDQLLSSASRFLLYALYCPCGSICFAWPAIQFVARQRPNKREQGDTK